MLAASDVRPQIDHPLLEAELLLAAVLNKSRSYFRAWPDQQVTEAVKVEFQALLSRRIRGEPSAYILGKKEFWSLELQVTPDTLIPRPDTECLVESALALFDASVGVKVADLGTGSGAIALAIASERPAWQVTAVDISDKALRVAEKNAQSLQIKNVSFYQGSWCAALPANDYQLIISNPPYISEQEWPEYAEGLLCEPKSALVSGLDGLDSIRQIISTAHAYLKCGGCLMIEHGFWQGQQVRELFGQAGYIGVVSVCDLAGQERFTMGKYT